MEEPMEEPAEEAMEEHERSMMALEDEYEEAAPEHSPSKSREIVAQQSLMPSSGLAPECSEQEQVLARHASHGAQCRSGLAAQWSHTSQRAHTSLLAPRS